MRRDSLSEARPVIVSGTPFAGSSIIGEILASAGVFLGDDLPLPKHSNFCGLAADREMAALNDRLLAAAGTRWDECLTLESLPISEADSTACEELLHRKFLSHERWGWVDPRTVPLLDHWAALLPGATWIFVVRPPETSVWSMTDRPLSSVSPELDPEICATNLRLWLAYAQRICAFARRYGERTLLISSPDELFAPQQARLAARLTAATGITVSEESVARTFDPLLIRVEAPAEISELVAGADIETVRSDLETLGLRLGSSRRPARAHGPKAGGEPPRVCMASLDRCAYSETFIRAQLNRLPAEMFHLWGQPQRPKRTQDCLWVVEDESILRSGFGADLEDSIRRSLVRYLREHRIEAVLGQYGITCVEYLEPCAELGIPLIPHFHGFDAYRNDLLASYETDYRRLFEAAPAIIVVSTDMARQLEGLGAPREKIRVIPCGVDPDRFGGADPFNAPPTFLAVGRFVAKKGPQLTLHAFSQVLERRPDARLVMIGEGGLKSPCMHLARAMGIDGSVDFGGARPHSEVVRRMRSARAFVQHSVRPENGDSEGTPVAVMEAGAAGLPVVASAHAGIADVVQHGETGFLVEETDTRAMAEYMIALADDPALATRLGQKASERIRAEYSFDVSIARLWKVIHDAISSTGGFRPDA
jgi:glycosyltransferase involved in cell wall biosynthesis